MNRSLWKPLGGGALALLTLALAVACSDNAGDIFEEHSADSGANDSKVDSGATPEASVVPPTPTDAASDAPIEDKNLGKSAGCGKAGAGTGFQTRTMKVAGQTRDYLRFIPAGYDPAKPMPMVFALHGSGGTAAIARNSFELEGAAAGKAIFVYPQGLPYDPAFPGVNRWQTAQGSDDFTFIDMLLAEVEATHCIDRDRVYMAGFSHGARMTSMVGCFRGDKFRAIATAAPGGDTTTLPLAGCVGEVALWGSLGTEDAEHAPGTTLVRNYYSGVNGCTQTLTPTTPKGCEAYQGCRVDVPVTWCSFTGGHMWPSFGAVGAWGFFSAFK